MKLKLIPGHLISIILYYIHFFLNFKFSSAPVNVLYSKLCFYNSHILIETLEINCFLTNMSYLVILSKLDYLPAAGKKTFYNKIFVLVINKKLYIFNKLKVKNEWLYIVIQQIIVK